MEPISTAAKALGLLRRFWYVLPILGLLIALTVTRATLSHRTDQLATATAYNELVITTTREAAGSPRLSPRDVPAQIAALGRSVAALQDGLNLCNASAHAAADNDAHQQAVAADVLRAAQTLAQASQGVSARLRASAAAPRPAGAACEPSEALRETWR